MSENDNNSAAWDGLMQAAQNGDQRAYHQLLSEISLPLRRYVARRIFQRDIVDDIVQDILLAIHKVRHTYRPDKPFARWMYGVARYKTIDYLRKNKRIQDREFSSAYIETFSESQTNNPTDGLAHDLERAIGQLPEKQQRVLTLTKIQGQSVADVAKEMDMTESAVKVTTHRAVKKLKTLLVEHENR